MKKVFAAIITVALILSLSVTAFADGPNQSGNAGPGQQQTGGFQQGQMPSGAPQMNGQAPDGNSQPPQMNGHGPGMGGPNSSGETPSDLPELPDMNGQPPQMNGQAPGMGGPNGNGEAPSDLPELPGMNGQMPGMDGRGPSMGPQAPGFVDFDAMVTQGVITQDTCDRIKAWMEEHKPADLPEIDGQAPDGIGQPPEMNGEAPDGSGQPPEKPDMGGPNSGGEAPTDRPELPEMDGDAPVIGGLLAELLENEIITQSEYDALIAAQAK